MRKMKQILMKSKLLLLPILMFFIFTVLPNIVLAQSGFDNNTGSDTGGVDVVDVPLDGGTVILIAAGVLFGVYKLYKIAQDRLVTTN